MFGKVKRWLGIEGVKISLLVPEEIIGETGVIRGEVKLESMHAQTVTHIRLTLSEKYTRGRSKHKLTDLYKLGEIELDETVDVPAHEPVLIEFEIPFIMAKSEMDELADKNVVLHFQPGERPGVFHPNPQMEFRQFRSGRSGVTPPWTCAAQAERVGDNED